MKTIFGLSVLLLFYLSYVPYLDRSYRVNQGKYNVSVDTNIIKKYHAYINEAELVAIKGNYLEASRYYDSSFALPTISFAQDLYNASICELENKNHAKAINYCLKLVEKGCTEDFFKKKVYKSLRSNNKFWLIFQQQYMSKRNFFLAHTNMALVKQIKQMIIADQNFFCERPKHLNDNIFLDSLFKNDQYLSNQVTILLQKYGYLSENLIGANVSDTTLSIYPLFNVLIRHHYQLRQYNLSHILRLAVNKGELKPDIFCSWYNFEKKPVGYGEDFYIKKYKCNLYETNNKSLKDRIEHNRHIMWLPKLEDLKEKIIYRSCLEKDKLIFYAPIAILPPMDETAELTLKSLSILLPFKPIECR